MLKWLLYVIPSFIFTILCYLTNPIIVLFADDDGELHGFLHYWQTWDNPTNPSDLLTILPSCMTTWYDGHYEEYYASIGELARLGRGRWYTKCYNHTFTTKERVMRYLCRVYWLTRNSAYGFCFYLLGADQNPYHTWASDGYMTMDIDDTSMWQYTNSDRIFWKLYWNINLGWKLRSDAQMTTRCMIANRVTFKIK